ncbi:MAG: hypothetical protein ACTSWX_02465 [Promethearchaeota archaeon]
MPYYDYVARIKKRFSGQDSAIANALIAYWDKMHELTKKYKPNNFHEKAWAALFDIRLCDNAELIKLKRETKRKFSLQIMRYSNIGRLNIPFNVFFKEIWEIMKPYVENIIKTVPNITGIDSSADITPFLNYTPDLAFLNLSGVPNMRNFSPNIWTLKKLVVLYISAPKIREIPDEIRFLTELKKFELGDCDSLVKISPFIVKLPKLKTLLIRDCPKLKELPETFLELPDYIDFQILRCENMHFSKLFKRKLKEIDPFFCWKWIGNSNSL